jgi:hypothetical protein
MVTAFIWEDGTLTYEWTKGEWVKIRGTWYALTTLPVRLATPAEVEKSREQYLKSIDYQR